MFEQYNSAGKGRNYVHTSGQYKRIQVRSRGIIQKTCGWWVENERNALEKGNHTESTGKSPDPQLFHDHNGTEADNTGHTKSKHCSTNRDGGVAIAPWKQEVCDSCYRKSNQVDCGASDVTCVSKKACKDPPHCVRNSAYGYDASALITWDPIGYSHVR